MVTSAEGAWTDQPEDMLFLRAVRHVVHTVDLKGREHIEARIRPFVGQDWHERQRGAKACIGEAFATV